MIEELFYPKELKKIICQLEEESNLRREPLRKINITIRILVMMTILLVLLLLFSGDFFSALACIGCCFLVIYFFVNASTFYLYPYVLGKDSVATVIKFKTKEFRRVIPNKDIICRLDVENRDVIIHCVSIEVIKNLKIEVGSYVPVFYCSGSKYVAPDLPDFKHEYCLRKDLM